MTGSGKTTVAKMFEQKNFSIVRLGQLTLDIIKQRGLSPTEKNERPIREDLRKQYGLGAYAILNFEKIDSLVKKGDVVIDGLYAWEEFLEFKKKYPDFITLAIYARPSTRYKRLSVRSPTVSDEQMNYRRISESDAVSRDISEIENINKAGPIAMAQHTIINEESMDDLSRQFNKLLESLHAQ